MRSLRAFRTVCSSWATAWPTTRRAWTTRRTSRPCARKCPLWPAGFLFRGALLRSVRAWLRAGALNSSPARIRACWAVGFSTSGLGQGLHCPKGSCGLRWAGEDPPTQERGPAQRILTRRHRGAGTRRAGTQSEGRKLLAVPRSTLRQSSSFPPPPCVRE